MSFTIEEIFEINIFLRESAEGIQDGSASFLLLSLQEPGTAHRHIGGPPVDL
jgi:hypothetical protein